MPAKKPDAEVQAVAETPTADAHETETPVEAAAEAEVIEDGPSFARFVSVNPEPGGYPFGPYIPNRLEVGSKILCWFVPLDDVENMLSHFYVVSGRVRLQDVKKLGE